jgi:hypothetical protein
MNHLADLRNLLRTASEELLHGLSFDLKEFDKEIVALEKWLGDRGSDTPPTDAIAKALDEFIANAKVKNRRQALLLCHGCANRIGKSGYRLIEDAGRFSALLAALDAFEKKPRMFRPCYRGLLNAYFEYDFGAAKPDGRKQWELLRAYLLEKLPQIFAEGMQPTWVDVLADNRQLLGEDPGGHYGTVVLTGDTKRFDHVRETFAIGGETWLIRQVVLGQVIAATKMADDEFIKKLPNLLSLLVNHRLVADAGLKSLLDRYQSCRNPVENANLRDFSVAQWNNPWLDANAARWSLVKPETKTMVAGWLKLELIRKFFDLLAADGVNDPRRVKFWERYHESIHDMYFALGRDAMERKSPDFVKLRAQMKGRLLELLSPATDNNAFIMCIGDYVMVEFGAKNNACYVFARNNLPFKLNSREITDDRYGLKSQSNEDRLVHRDSGDRTWEQKFSATHYLRTARVSRHPPSAATSPRAPQPATAVGSAAKPPVGAQRAPTAAQLNMLDTARGIVDRSAAGFSFEALTGFCAKHGLHINDHRSENGNLWVRTDNLDAPVTKQLQQWGFRYKNAFKGWWRD